MAIRVLIIVLVLAAVAAYMCSYVVRFNESAVVTTFGSANKDSVVTSPGPRAKWPYPFQKVTVYDNRLRIIQSDQETQQTADKSQIILASFLTWRVKDPLEFFKRFGGSGDSSAREHYKAAESILKARLRAASAAVSQFSISDLVSSSAQGSKLPALEKAMLDSLKGATEADAALAAYGIEPVEVGVMNIGLPTETTRAVFEHMKTARDAIANAVVQQGTAEASQIRSTAEENAKRIQAFADQLAATIRAEGDVEAAKFLSQMKEEPQLAVFIQNMDFYRKTWGRSTTLVLPTSLPGFDLLKPDATKRFSTGRPPSLDVPAITKPGGPKTIGTLSETPGINVAGQPATQEAGR